MAVAAVQAVAVTGYLFVHGVVPFVLLATLLQLAWSAGGAAFGPMLARAGGVRLAVFRAKARAYNNLGVVIGTVGAGFAVQIGTRTAYSALILADAASFVGCALFLLRVPNYPPLPKPPAQRRFASLTDRPFVLFTALEGLMGLQYPVLSVLLPIWLTTRTNAPHWTVAGVALVSAGVCVVLQTRLGARVETPRQGGRAAGRCGGPACCSWSAVRCWR